MKKAIPFILMSGLVLGACTTHNNGALPNNNETPMQNMDERERNWAPNLRENQNRGGADLDGIDNDNRTNGNRNGVINEDHLNNDNNNMFRDDNGPLIDENLNRNNNNR